MKNKALIDLLEEAISYGEQARDLIESCEMTASPANYDRRLILAEEFIAKCEKQIQELNAF